MADYIIKGETLTGIADAIRRKTGGTESINPTDMPGQIDGISGGGGLLPVGAYWTGALPTPKNTYYQKWVYFNGALYAFTSSLSTGGSKANIFKYEDGAWVAVLSDVISGVGTVSGGQFVEYNGALHVFGGDLTNHKIFDGSTYSDGVALPSAVATGAVAVWNGKIYSQSYKDGNLYYFDEATQTWVVEASVGSTYSYYYLFVYNNELYMVNGNDLYKYSGGVKVKVATLTNRLAGGSWFAVKGNWFYYFSSVRSSGPSYFNKINMNTLDETSLGYFGGYPMGGLVDINGELGVLSGYSGYLLALNIMHEVTE